MQCFQFFQWSCMDVRVGLWRKMSAKELMVLHFIFIYFLIFFLLYFFKFFLFYNIVLVLPYINMNPPWVYIWSQSWTLLPSPSPYHPSGSSQCTSPKLPVSCIEPGLAIRFLYGIVHVSMPFSQIILPSLSHRVQKTVLELMLLNCGIGEDSWESLGLQGDPTSPS